MTEQLQLEKIFYSCFKKERPKNDFDLFAFYLGICNLHKAINQASASILMETDMNEEHFLSYQKKKEKKLDELYEAFKEYVYQIKVFENEGYLIWVRKMSEETENTNICYAAKHCYVKIHSVIF